MIGTMMFGVIRSTECFENVSSGCEDPSSDELPKRLGGRFCHRGGKDLQERHERCCNVH